MAVPFFLTRWLVKSGLARFWPAARKLAGDSLPYLPYCGNRVLAAPCRQLAEIAPFFASHAADVIDLASAVPQLDLVPSMSTRLPGGLRGYPPAQGLAELREAIAEKLHSEGKGDVSPHDEVLVTQGAAGALNLVLDSFLDPGDAVVLLDPCSPLYALTLQQRRLRIRWLPTWMEAGRTRFHLAPLVKALRGARLLIVNSPANPTGGLLAREDLEQLAWWSKRHDVLLFSDDCFERFVHDGGAAPHLSSFVKTQGRLFCAGSFSQGYGLASARVGWLTGSKHLIRPCTVTAAMQAALVPTLSQQLALSALQQGDQAFAPIRASFRSRRDYAYERLAGLGLEPEKPAASFFVWFSVDSLGYSGRRFAEALFKAKKVLVWPGEHFGPSGKGHVRVSFCGDEGRLREGLSRIAAFLGHKMRAAA